MTSAYVKRGATAPSPEPVGASSPRRSIFVRRSLSPAAVQPAEGCAKPSAGWLGRWESRRARVKQPQRPVETRREQIRDLVSDVFRVARMEPWPARPSTCWSRARSGNTCLLAYRATAVHTLPPGSAEAVARVARPRARNMRGGRRERAHQPLASIRPCTLPLSGLGRREGGHHWTGLAVLLSR